MAGTVPEARRLLGRGRRQVEEMPLKVVDPAGEGLDLGVGQEDAGEGDEDAEGETGPSLAEHIGNSVQKGK